MRNADAIRVFAENLRRGDVVQLSGGERRVIHGFAAEREPMPGTSPGRYLELLYQPDGVGDRPVPGIVVHRRQLMDVLV